MKLLKPVNKNYCAYITKINNLIPLNGCDNIQGTTIFGNHVILSKDVKHDDLGVYFPPETQLDAAFLSNNNLYRDKSLNQDKEKTGYFELNGRVRVVTLRKHQSAGVWFPINCFDYLPDKYEFKAGDHFDAVAIQNVGTLPICRKYVIRKFTTQGLPGTKKQRKSLKCSKALENQFRFHPDTDQLGKNIHKIDPDDIISITYKLHGTSFIGSRLLCKKKPSFSIRLLKTLLYKIPLTRNINIPISFKTGYDDLYSSRKVVKNDEIPLSLFLNKQGNQHYYEMDIWGEAYKKIKYFLVDGLSIYGEIVGHIPGSGKAIQPKYDYGCDKGEFDVYIYRITYTNPSGIVFEFSAKQVQDWCAGHGLYAVPQLYYGRAKDIFDWLKTNNENLSFSENLLKVLKDNYLEKNCYMCHNKVPAEGIVLRREQLNFEAYKLKSFAFLKMETDLLDKGETNIEDNQGQEDEEVDNENN